MGVCVRTGRELIKGECDMCSWDEKYFRCIKIERDRGRGNNENKKQ